jgi:hypothetical protein
MKHEQVHASHADHSKVRIARGYLAHGFLDAAMRLFCSNAALVEKRDWRLLVEHLMERQRVSDAMLVCEVGDVPVPREQLLALGDGCLRRRNLDSAIRFYELGDADRERWSLVLDALTASPDQERRAIEIAERHLVGEEPIVELRAAGAR